MNRRLEMLFSCCVLDLIINQKSTAHYLRTITMD